jgi:RimJ/RimL family protein N-acetyltransferase
MADTAFTALASQRLVLRRFRADDLDAFVAYRSDPVVARFQSDYLLVERGKHRVVATCDDRNIRSAAVLERVGMRREGRLLESTWSKGEWTSDLLYGVLRREWPPGP